MRHLTLLNFIAILFLGLIFAFSCDTPPGNIDPTKGVATVKDISVVPDTLRFDRSDGIKDTTVTLSITAVINRPELLDSLPVFSIKSNEKDSIILKGSLKKTGKSQYNASTLLELRTTLIANYTIYVYTSNPSGGLDWVQTNLPIIGFSNKPPKILSASNPDTVTIPDDDSRKIVPFTAKVTDPDGQDNIRKVLMEIIRDSGESIGEFKMLDDGSASSGDTLAGDSVYTKTLQIDSSNTPDSFNIHYQATDKTGLESDTVKTTFTIIE